MVSVCICMVACVYVLLGGVVMLLCLVLSIYDGVVLFMLSISDLCCLWLVSEISDALRCCCVVCV